MKTFLNSIRGRILIPLMTILLIQSIILFAFVIYGGVSQRLQSNAIDILDENTENSKLQMERELVNHWMRDIQTSSHVNDAVEKELKRLGQSAGAIKNDPELNRQLLYEAMDPLLDLLHRSYGTGVFVILDGPAAVNGSKDAKAGVYIRDLDPSSYAYDNSDLLLERGLPSISKEYGIPLDSFWELGFSVDSCESAEYYCKPYGMSAGKAVEQSEAANYGYLGGLMSLDPLDTRVLTYSMPLVLSDGTVIGVIGGDMSETQLVSILNEKAEEDDSVICFLGMRQKGDSSVRPVAANGVLLDSLFGKEGQLDLAADVSDTVGQIRDKNGSVWYAGIKTLDIYNHNTPFNSEEWVMVRMVEEDSLFTFYTKMKSALTASLVICLTFGMIAMLVVGSIITNPIRKLIRELRGVGRGEQITLGKTHIEEVDELIDAIEGLSRDVASSASKISDILAASGIPMGAFEYTPETGQVFCSSGLFKLLQFPGPEGTYAYLGFEDFITMMKKLIQEEERDGSELYFFEGEDGIRWLRMRRVLPETGGSVVGVFTDVTADILERKKLEKERDFDLLTNIYNRRAFRKIAEGLLHNPPSESMAFVMWDLDNLKYVNDTYGHEEGDRYIRLFADYLRELEQVGAVVERHAGDEFMAVLPRGTREEQRGAIRDFTDNMKNKMLELADGYRIPLRASAGVAWYPDHAADFDKLSRYADFAMYMAKHSVKGIVQEFSAESYRSNSYLLSGKEELNHLLEEKQVRYALQPIVDREGKIYGYEALMRPNLSCLKSIEEVLRLARNQAKLRQMEELTWITAMGWFDRLDREGRLEPGTRFFINSIADVVLEEESIRRIERAYPGLLCRVVLEMTESEPQENCIQVKVRTMKRWGAMTAIDDYGAGYSNESMILRLHPQIVKLDMELVRNVDQDRERQEMLKNVTDFCHRKEIMVTAEGVETPAELEALLGLGIDLFQGYYLGRPEIEVRPLDPFVAEKIRELSKK